jgi:hypothetical protein
MAQLAKLARQIMRRLARLDHDNRWRQLGKKLHHRLAVRPLAQHHRFRCVNSVGGEPAAEPFARSNLPHPSIPDLRHLAQFPALLAQLAHIFSNLSRQPLAKRRDLRL